MQETPEVKPVALFKAESVRVEPRAEYPRRPKE
jgi:hypothetical protein